ncbi:magnesium chelatase domain-containing protein [Streptomyces sp. NPDC003362]
MAITADTSDGELYEVRNADGRALYQAPSTPVSPLDDSKADDVTRLLKRAFLFGDLDEAGWQTAAEGEPYRSITLPTVDMARRSTAASSFPTPEGMATITAEYTPGATPAFQITGPNSKFTRETRDRIRAAVITSGLEWEPGLMQIVAHWTVVRAGSSSDLALACTALAAAGVIDPATLNGVAMIGELGLDGRVRGVRDVTDTVRTGQEAGYRKFIVARDDFDTVSENSDIASVGVNDLTAALAFLFEMHEPETITPAPKAPTQGTPGEEAGQCAQCSKLLIWDRSGKRLNDE